MTIEEIKELIQLVHESGVAELELQRGEDRVRIRRQPQAFEFAAAAPAPQNIAAPVAVAPVAAVAAPAADPLNDPSLVVVKSPIVGTYYDAPSPGAPVFINPGESVATGKVLCIIESMKLMNEIESEHNGTIVSKLVENGRPVEYGEALFVIRPA